jgi:hypothetical protein
VFNTLPLEAQGKKLMAKIQGLNVGDLALLPVRAV